MSDFDQVPFDQAPLIENPEPRCPCLLLLDTSGSMRGEPIAELNAGLLAFKNSLMSDPLARKRVEVAVMTFGPVKVVNDFITADEFSPATLTAQGDTPLGEAVVQGLGLLERRKQAYRAVENKHYRPWVFLITDGAPTDDWSRAASFVQEGERARKLSFYAVGVQDANFTVLKQLSVREPLRLQGLMFREMFQWLSNSLKAVSQSQPGTEVTFSAPRGWGSTDL